MCARDRWLLLAGFVLLTIWRMPAVIFEGRFWAEEATVFYVHAATTPWRQALFYSYAGYMNLGANAPAVAARHLVPIDHAPRITLVFAFAAQLCPALLLVTSHAAWLRSRLALAASLLLLVAAPSSEEVWLNTLHSQFHLGLCVALILALEIEPGGRELFRRILLFLAPLYGLVAVISLSLFAVRAFVDRSRDRLIQTVVLASGSAIQLLFFYHSNPARQTLNIKLIPGTIFAKNIMLPFLSFDASRPVATWLHAALFQRHPADSGSGDDSPCRGATIQLGSQRPKACVVVHRGIRRHQCSFLLRRVAPHARQCRAACRRALCLRSAGSVRVGLGIDGCREPGFPRQDCVHSGVLAVHRQHQRLPETGPRVRSWTSMASGIAKWHTNPSYTPVAWPGGQWVVPLPKP